MRKIPEHSAQNKEKGQCGKTIFVVMITETSLKLLNWISTEPCLTGRVAIRLTMTKGRSRKGRTPVVRYIRKEKAKTRFHVPFPPGNGQVLRRKKFHVSPLNISKYQHKEFKRLKHLEKHTNTRSNYWGFIWMVMHVLEFHSLVRATKF